LNINKDISLAKTIDSSFYTSRSIFDLSISNIFKKTWQLVYHKSFSTNNNIYPFTFLKDLINEPLVITKDSNEKLTCLSNVCTHRGHLVSKKSCKDNKLQCNYHGRTFKLNGQIKHMPGFKGVKNFPLKTDNLTTLPMINWENFMFTGINPEIDIKPILENISNRLKNFDFNKLYYDENLSKTYHLDAHWALYCENYLEGFHVPFVHKKLTSQINIKSYKTEILSNGVLQYAKDKNKKSYGYYYWIFPNLMFNFYDWGLSINIVEPISTNKSRIKFLTFPLTQNSLNKNFIDELHEIEMEDEEVVINVQRGIKSKFYNSGRYSVEHEKGIHYFHQLLTKYC